MENLIQSMRHVIGTLVRGLAFVAAISAPFAMVYLVWDWVGVYTAIVCVALSAILYILGLLVRVERGEI